MIRRGRDEEWYRIQAEIAFFPKLVNGIFGQKPYVACNSFYSLLSGLQPDSASSTLQNNLRLINDRRPR
jgi:hypothetical protein